jgi:protein-S-isoprenylcysteine O-methyltransferase Ste14
MIVAIGNFFFRYRNGLFPLVYALLIFKSEPLLPDYRVAALAGLLVALAGQLIRGVTVGLEYIIRGGRHRQVYADKLVQGGMFAHCRNPLYIGNFIIVMGVGIASNSRIFLGVAVPFFVFAYWAIIAAEENWLRNKFGQEFDDYCARVNRLLPRLTGLRHTLSGMQFNWRRLITAEYGSAYLWMAAIPLVTLKNAWMEDRYFSDKAVTCAAWGFLAAATLAYLLARLLKKSGALRRPATTATSAS